MAHVHAYGEVGRKKYPVKLQVTETLAPLA